MARVVYCDRPECKSSCSLSSRNLSDEAIAPMLEARGWQTLWNPSGSGLISYFCPVHHDTRPPSNATDSPAISE